MQNCVLKQKGERKRWRSCCWGKGIPFVRLFRPIPPAGWNPWLAFTLFGFQARAEVAVFGSRETTNAVLKCIFSECLLLKHFHIWRWMCHTVFLKSWDICKKKKYNHTKTAEQQEERHIEKNSYSLIEWQMCEHPVGLHKGFCAIRIVPQSEWFRTYIQGIKEAHGVFEAHYERGKNRGLQGLYTLKPGVPLGVFSYSPSSDGTRQLLNCPTSPSAES